MVSLPQNSLQQEERKPSHGAPPDSRADHNASVPEVKEVAFVITTSAQVFPTDKPGPDLGGTGVRAIEGHHEVKKSSVTLLPTASSTQKFKGGNLNSPPNVKSKDDVLMLPPSTSPPHVSDPSTTVSTVSVATLSENTGTASPGMQGTIAAIVLPVIGLLVILAIILFIVRKRKGRRHGYKRKGNQDEENSSEATAALMSESTPNGSPIKTTEEPLYAVVDKSKKRKNTQSLSVTDETVPLRELSVTTNGSCPTTQGSEDSLLQVINARDDEEDVFSVEEVQKIKEQPIYDVPPDESKAEDDRSIECIKEERADEAEEDKKVEIDAPATGLMSTGIEEIGVDGRPKDLTLVECDIYETAEADGSNNDDDNDSTYEIPDSPATVRARKAMLRRSHCSRPTSIKMPMPVLDSSESDSELESDFEEIASRHKSFAPEDPSEKEELNKGLDPPPVPVLLPESDNDSEYYMSPECHTHRPPGPGWKPFHEYDPVYVPHSDPAGMDRRVDSQNYVRNRQRSDSRLTHPYEEIQFGGIYATVDDEDSMPVVNGQAETPVNKPPLPPPLVPRRTRPISGIADMGRLSIHRAVDPEKGQEPRYSGLIKDDVSDPDDETPHEYTPLEYTKLRTQESGPMVSDDIKHIDDTDSETYTKYAAPPLLKRRSGGETKDIITNGDKIHGPYCPLIKQEENRDEYKLYNGYIEGNIEDNENNDQSSSESDDSYEPFDFNPPDYPQPPAKETS